MGAFLYITNGETGVPDERDQLAREIRRLQKQLARVSEASLFDAAASKSTTSGSESRVRGILNLRTRRAQIFDNALFGEPAWDMLLQLYDARLQRRTEYVTGLCVASGVPPSTALRWITSLLDSDWIERSFDLGDRRRVIVSLTVKGVDAMERFFSQPEFTAGL